MPVFLFAQDLPYQDSNLTVDDCYDVSLIFADVALLEAVKFGIRYMLEQRFPDSQINQQRNWTRCYVNAMAYQLEHRYLRRPHSRWQTRVAYHTFLAACQFRIGVT